MASSHWPLWVWDWALCKQILIPECQEKGNFTLSLCQTYGLKYHSFPHILVVNIGQTQYFLYYFSPSFLVSQCALVHSCCSDHFWWITYVPCLWWCSCVHVAFQTDCFSLEQFPLKTNVPLVSFLSSSASKHKVSLTYSFKGPRHLMQRPDAHVRLGENTFGWEKINPLLVFEKEAVF